MATYETIFITPPNLAEEDEKVTVDSLASIITDGGGEISVNDRLGRRRLAYPIQKFEDGVYTRFLYDSEAAVPKELERRIRLTENVIRVLTVRIEPDWATAMKEQAIRDAQRRVEMARQAALDAEQAAAAAEAAAVVEAEKAAAALAEAEAAPDVAASDDTAAPEAAATETPAAAAPEAKATETPAAAAPEAEAPAEPATDGDSGSAEKKAE